MSLGLSFGKLVVPARAQGTLWTRTFDFFPLQKSLIIGILNKPKSSSKWFSSNMLGPLSLLSGPRMTPGTQQDSANTH